MKSIGFALGLLLFSTVAHAADAHLDAQPNDEESIAERARLYPIGSGATVGTSGVLSFGTTEGIDAYVYVDGRGLGPAALARLIGGLTCTDLDELPDTHTALIHVICAISTHTAFGWNRASDGSAQWMAYLVMDRWTFRHLKGYARVGAQRTRIDVIGRWSGVRALGGPRCRLFFPNTRDTGPDRIPGNADDVVTTWCAGPTPPIVFYGVTP